MRVCMYLSVWRADRDTVVTRSEVAVIFHIDTDLPCMRPVCIYIAVRT